MSDPSFDTGFALDAAVPARTLDPGRRYDVLVVGAGPAGISAAIYLVRKGLATGVVAPLLGGQVAWTSGTENYLGYRRVDGAALVERFREQVAEHAPDRGIGLEVSALERRGEGFAVRAGGAWYAARALVVATGKRPRQLDVPGERRLLGRLFSYHQPVLAVRKAVSQPVFSSFICCLVSQKEQNVQNKKQIPSHSLSDLHASLHSSWHLHHNSQWPPASVAQVPGSQATSKSTTSTSVKPTLP